MGACDTQAPMKIAVIGAGIVGVSTAYELASDGHEVAVYDRRSAVAEEASFACGSLLGPGCVEPAQAPIDVGLRLSVHELAWLWQRRKLPVESPVSARAKTLALAVYSRSRHTRLAHRLSLAFDQRDGLMLLFRTAQDEALAQPHLQALRDAGVVAKPLTPAVARKLELALNTDTPLHSAAYLQEDGAGNCRQFALLLKSAAQAKGVRFHMGATVQALQRAAPTELRLANNPTPQRHDAVVVCAGAAAVPLLQPLGLRVPLVGVQGWSISAQIREPLNTPHSAVLDMHHRVSIARIGHRVRVAGGAEMGRGDHSSRGPALQTLYRVLHDWFPGAARIDSDVQAWRAEQAMMLDGLPLLGASGIPGVWLNLGHGASGWALASGTARLVADCVLQRPPEVDLAGLGADRLRARP